MNEAATARPAIAAATTLGVGLGGFFDGILFHQILQVHNMLSARVSTEDVIGAKINMIWDGLFHAAVWVITCAGVVMLWRAAGRGGVRFETRLLAGGFLLGWGLFNTVEGVIDHHILHLHHVYERLGLSMFDYAFLAWGVAMIVLGGLLVRTRSRSA